MSTIMTIAQNIFDEPPKFTKSSKEAMNLIEALVDAEFIDQEDVEQILTHDQLTFFFKRKTNQSSEKKSAKKKSADPSERDGVVDKEKCHARIWSGTGKNSNYDNVQCSAKMVDGCGCFCKQHFAKDLACKKIEGLDGWFLGLVTEEKPEKPMVATGWRAADQEYSLEPSDGELVEHFWADSEEEKPKKKKAKKPKKAKDDSDSEEEEEKSSLSAPTFPPPEDLDEDDSSDEEEETYYEHEGVQYRVSAGNLIDGKSSKIIGHMDGGEPTLTNLKVHKKNVKRLSR